MVSRRSRRQVRPLLTPATAVVPLLRESPFALEFAAGRASDGCAASSAPEHSGNPARAKAHGATAMSNDTSNLFTSDAEGVTGPATADEILHVARTILARRVRKGASISNPRATREYLRLRLAVQGHEVFAIHITRQPPPRHRIRSALSRHHRRCVRPPPRGGQGGAEPQCSGRDTRAQPPLGGGGAFTGG